jgi:hypothetical protein
VTFGKIGAGRAMHFLRAWKKLHLRPYSETLRHFWSKERPGDTCVLPHEIRHLQRCYFQWSTLTLLKCLVSIWYIS